MTGQRRVDRSGAPPRSPRHRVGLQSPLYGAAAALPSTILQYGVETPDVEMPVHCESARQAVPQTDAHDGHCFTQESPQSQSTWDAQDCR
jgi:hypothetical protein